MLPKTNIDVYKVLTDFKMRKEIPNGAYFYNFSDKRDALKFFNSKVEEYVGESLEFSDPDDNNLVVEYGNKEISLTSPDFSTLASSDSPYFPHYGYMVYVGIQMTDSAYNEIKKKHYFPENVMN